MTAPTYRIETVPDFFAVPAERRSACLKDFATFLDIAEATQHLLEAVADTVVGEGAVKFPFKAFEWIDDDENTVTLRVLNVDDSEAANIALR